MGRVAGSPAWREFRFAFVNEVRDAAGLEAQLREMRAELDGVKPAA